jgi:hypothetical protein
VKQKETAPRTPSVSGELGNQQKGFVDAVKHPIFIPLGRTFKTLIFAPAIPADDAGDDRPIALAPQQALAPVSPHCSNASALVHAGQR